MAAQVRLDLKRRSLTMPSWGRVCLLCAALSALTLQAMAAEPLRLPPLGRIEEGRYRAREVRTGATLWEEDWALRQTGPADHPILSVEESGQGLRESSTPTAWKLMMEIRWGSAPHVDATREVRDPTGRLERIEKRELDYAHGSGQFHTTDVSSGKTTSREVSISRGTIIPELLAATLRTLPESPGQQMRFDLVTHEGSVVGMEAKVVGEEQVVVPAGSCRCYKVELAPTGFIGLVAGLVMPKFVMWHTVSAPHVWVRFQGPAFGLGSPEIVRELVRFQVSEAGRMLSNCEFERKASLSSAFASQ